MISDFKYRYTVYLPCLITSTVKQDILFTFICSIHNIFIERGTTLEARLLNNLGDPLFPGSIQVLRKCQVARLDGLNCLGPIILSASHASEMVLGYATEMQLKSE